MRKRLFLATATMAALVGVVLIVLAMLPGRPGVTKANVNRIEIGMTETEVQAILGGLPNAELRYQQKELITIIKLDHPNKGWMGDDGFAIIKFDADGKAIEKLWAPNPQSLMQKILRFLHM